MKYFIQTIFLATVIKFANSACKSRELPPIVPENAANGSISNQVSKKPINFTDIQLMQTIPISIVVVDIITSPPELVEALRIPPEQRSSDQVQLVQDKMNEVNSLVSILLFFKTFLTFLKLMHVTYPT
jgi:hypothetical protein